MLFCHLVHRSYSIGHPYTIIIIPPSFKDFQKCLTIQAMATAEIFAHENRTQCDTVNGQQPEEKKNNFLLNGCSLCSLCSIILCICSRQRWSHRTTALYHSAHKWTIMENEFNKTIRNHKNLIINLADINQ